MKRLIIAILLLAGMCSSQPVYNSFNAGELSPLLKYRTDVNQRYFGVETLENMLVRVQGAAFRRMGTEYIAGTKSNGSARLIPFEYSTDDAYILEFGDKYIRVYRNGGAVILPEIDNTYVSLFGVVSLWLLDEISGTTVTDSSGAFDMTASANATNFSVGGMLANGYDLNNTYYASLADDDSFSRDDTNDEGLSIAAAVYVEQTGANQTILSKWQEGGDKEWLLRLDESARLQLVLKSTADAEPPTTNIIGWWKMDDTDADKVVDEENADGDGNTYNGTSVRNVSTLSVTGEIDTALKFEPASSDKITTAAEIIPTSGDFALSCWVLTYGDYEGSVLDERGVVCGNLGWDNQTVTGIGIRKNTSTDQLLVTVGNGTTDASYVIKDQYDTLEKNNWNKVTVTYDLSETQLDIYWNETLVSSNTFTYGDSGENFGMGYSSALNQGRSYWNGAIDDVRIYDTLTYPVDTYSVTDNALTPGWHYVIATYDGSGGATAASGITFYVDGVAVNATAYNNADYQNMTNTNVAVYLGAHLDESSSATDIFSGVLDNVMFFSDDLTASEVSTICMDNDTTYEITTIFEDEDLRDIHYVQSNDVMYLVHPDYIPQKLTRYGHTYWTIRNVDWEWGPFLDQNTSTTTITPSGTTGDITLTASSAIFYPGHINSYWHIIEKTDNAEEGASNVAAGTSTTTGITVEGDFIFILEGDYTGTVSLMKSNDSFVNVDDPVFSKFNPAGETVDLEYTGEEAEQGWVYRVDYDTSAGDFTYSLVSYNKERAGYVEVIGYTDSTHVTATVIETLADTDPVTAWSEGAWSELRGYPRSICLYQNRLCLAGTEYQPNTFWASRSGEFEDMETASVDSSAIVYDMASANQNPIVWLADKDVVLAGTSGSVIKIYSTGDKTVMTPDNVGSLRQSQSGCNNLMPQLLGDSIVYTGRNSKQVKDIIYDLQRDGYVSPDLTAMAEHISSDGFVEVATQYRPDPIIWYIRSDGQACSFTYNRDQKVVAWARHITDGTFESVAVIPGTNEDEVWFVVLRDGNYYIEQMQPNDWFDDANTAWFVDCGTRYGDDASETATDTITGLTWLEGETVQVFDGDSFETATVSSGSITLSETVSDVIIGLPYTSTLTTFPIELENTLGYKKKIYEIVPSFYETRDGDYLYKGQFKDGTTYAIPWSKWPDPLYTVTLPYTGQVRCTVEGNWDDEARVGLVMDEPYPFNVTSLIIKMELSEN